MPDDTITTENKKYLEYEGLKIFKQELEKEMSNLSDINVDEDNETLIITYKNP